MKMIKLVLVSAVIVAGSAAAAYAQDIGRDSGNAADAVAAVPLNAAGAILTAPLTVFGAPVAEGRSSFNPYLVRRHTEPAAFPNESNEQGYRNTGVTENPTGMGQ